MTQEIICELELLAGDRPKAGSDWVIRYTRDEKPLSEYGDRIHREYGALLNMSSRQPCIELGANPKEMDSPFIGINIKPGPGIDIVADLSEPWPLPSNRYGFAYSKFVIEHIRQSRVQMFIEECFRVLRAGGVAVIITADLLAQCKYLADIPIWRKSTPRLIFGGEPDVPEQYHRTGFSPQLAEQMFRYAGFSVVSVWRYPIYDLEMIIEAYK